MNQNQDMPLGRSHTVANGHLSYDIEIFEAGHIFPVATRLEKELGFESKGLPIFGLETVLLEMQRDGVKITVGWDHWSGLFIMADDDAGDEAIREIASHLETHKDLVLAEIRAADEETAASAAEDPEN